MQTISTDDAAAIEIACEKLAQGLLVIYPTETCYGIAADATNSEAVTRLLTYKGDRHRQVSIAVADRSMAEEYVEINEIADNIYNNFLPGPVTVISQSRHRVDERLESVSGTLGIRIPDHGFARDLIRRYGKAVTATSANTSGRKEPYSRDDWNRYTVEKKREVVALFLDSGRLEERPTSTVVDTTLNDPVILRQGEITVPEVSGQAYISTSEDETRTIGAEIIRKHVNITRRFPLIVALQGDLGAGKTQLTKGIAADLGIDTTIPSPTYMLMREYPYKLTKYRGTLYHIDTWRLADMSEIDSALGVSSVLKPGNIIVIEWAGKAKTYIEMHKKDSAVVMIDIKEKDRYKRTIKYSFSTPEWS